MSGRYYRGTDLTPEQINWFAANGARLRLEIAAWYEQAKANAAERRRRKATDARTEAGEPSAITD